MSKNLCTSTYSRERENDATTYTCVREHTHPGTHRSDVMEPYEAKDSRGFIIAKGESPVGWTDWEAFLAVARTGSDAQVLAEGTALAAEDDWYHGAVNRQPRYAALTAAR